MKIYRFILLVFFISVYSLTKAQNLTFEHDDQIMNQFNVMEIHYGVLKPAEYYHMMHKTYEASAYAPYGDKVSMRQKFTDDGKKEVQHSDTISRIYKRRAIIEGWNYESQNPKLDIAWGMEGEKITSKMDLFYKNISKIQARGGTSQDHKLWLNIYKCLQNDINILRKSWLTMGDRQKQYLTLYKRIVKYNSDLVAQEMEWNGHKEIQYWYSQASKPTRQTRNGTLAFKCLNRWNAAGAVHGFSTSK